MARRAIVILYDPPLKESSPELVFLCLKYLRVIPAALGVIVCDLGSTPKDACFDCALQVARGKSLDKTLKRTADKQDAPSLSVIKSPLYSR